jgi:hypothetical protein
LLVGAVLKLERDAYDCSRVVNSCGVRELAYLQAHAKFPVELVSVSQERVERTLLAKIIYHGIVGDAAQAESACHFFYHHESVRVSRSVRRVWCDGLGDREILSRVSLAAQFYYL